MNDKTKQPDEETVDDQVESTEPEGEVEIDLQALRGEIEQHETPVDDGADDGIEGEHIPGGGSRHDVNVAMLSMAIDSVFNILAIVRAPHWKLKRGEAKNAAEPLNALIEKYLGETDVGPEVAAAISLAGIILPRWMQDQGVNAEETNDAT